MTVGIAFALSITISNEAFIFFADAFINFEFESFSIAVALFALLRPGVASRAVFHTLLAIERDIKLVAVFDTLLFIDRYFVAATVARAALSV